MGGLRIAAFGGTFDPIHNGHVEIARAVVRQFDLDRLLIIPAYRPPHKRGSAIAGPFHRYAMSAIALLDEPRTFVSTMELEEPGRPYTFETIERLKSALGPKAKLFFVIGADSFEDINTWREPARLMSNTSLIVITRPGHDVDWSHLDAQFRSKIVDLRGSQELPGDIGNSSEHQIYLTGRVNTEVSSSEIRRLVQEGASIVDCVPPAVARYIEKYCLYRGQFDAS